MGRGSFLHRVGMLGLLVAAVGVAALVGTVIGDRLAISWWRNRAPGFDSQAAAPVAAPPTTMASAAAATTVPAPETTRTEPPQTTAVTSSSPPSQVPASTVPVLTTVARRTMAVVSDLHGDGRSQSAGWDASVVVEISDTSGIPIADAEVVGIWWGASPGYHRSTSDQVGRATFRLEGLGSDGVTFTVVSVTHPEHPFAPNRSEQLSVHLQQP